MFGLALNHPEQTHQQNLTADFPAVQLLLLHNLVFAGLVSTLISTLLANQSALDNLVFAGLVSTLISMLLANQSALDLLYFTI